MSFVKGSICSYDQFFLNYPYLIVVIKISLGISVLIFFRLFPRFFVDPGGPSQRIYSGLWSEPGPTKDKGIPPSFSSFSYLYIFLSPLSLNFALPIPYVKLCDRNDGNPYLSLAPPYRRRLWVKIHPLQTWPNCVLDTQIISKGAVYIIMLISRRFSFFQLVTLVLKLISYR